MARQTAFITMAGGLLGNPAPSDSSASARRCTCGRCALPSKSPEALKMKYEGQRAAFGKELGKYRTLANRGDERSAANGEIADIISDQIDQLDRQYNRDVASTIRCDAAEPVLGGQRGHRGDFVRPILGGNAGESVLDKP